MAGAAETNDMLNWIAWNRAVWSFKCLNRYIEILGIIQPCRVMFTNRIYLIYINKQDLAFNNL